MSIRSLVAVISLAGALPGAAEGQGTWEVTPGIGYYVPLGTLVTSEIAGADGPQERRHVGAVLGGLRLGRTMGWATLEVGVDYTPSLVAVRSEAGTRDLASGLVLASGRALFPLAGERADGRWSLRAGPGVGVVHRWGEAWDGFVGRTSVSGTGGVIARYVPDAYPVAFRVEAEGHLYRTGLRREGGTPDGEIHGELLWIVGVSVPLSP